MSKFYIQFYNNLTTIRLHMTAIFYRAAAFISRKKDKLLINGAAESFWC